MLTTLLSNENNKNLSFGFKKYTEFELGNVNILISVPHDGHLKPFYIPDRISDKFGNFKNDKNTRKFAKLLSEELKNLFLFNKGIQMNPYMVYNNLHRIKMDPNRDMENCCLNRSNEALMAYSDYHSIIDDFKKNFLYNSKYEQALILDIHGNSHVEEWIELGYLIKKSDLDSKFLDKSLKSSLNSLVSKSCFSLDEIIRGENISLGSMIQNRLNVKVVPSPKQKSPNDGNYYTGGYITERHGSFYDSFNGLNSIQIELPLIMRNEKYINMYAKSLACAIFEFYLIHSLDSCK